MGRRGGWEMGRLGDCETEAKKKDIECRRKSHTGRQKEGAMGGQITHLRNLGNESATGIYYL